MIIKKFKAWRNFSTEEFELELTFKNNAIYYKSNPIQYVEFDIIEAKFMDFTKDFIKIRDMCLLVDHNGYGQSISTDEFRSFILEIGADDLYRSNVELKNNYIRYFERVRVYGKD